MTILIRHRMMWCLIWVCTVCLCPITAKDTRLTWADSTFALLDFCMNMWLRKEFYHMTSSLGVIYSVSPCNKIDNPPVVYRFSNVM